MVKKKVKKKESIDSIPCKPIHAVGLIALFVVAFFALNVLGSGAGIGITGNAISGNAIENSLIENLFTNWSAGNLDVNIAKYLLFGMLSLLIFASLNYVKIPDNSAVQWLLAIPIAFLSTAYITPEEIFVVLTGYTALGLTLSTALPFIVMLFFSAMLLGNEKIGGMTVGKILLQFVLWGFFILFLAYKLIIGYSGAERNPLMLVVVWVIFGLSLLILFFNQKFRAWIRSLGIELKESKAVAAAAAIKASQTMGRATMASVKDMPGKEDIDNMVP